MNVEFITTLLSALAVIIPLAIKLVKVTIAAVKDKKWQVIVNLAIECMTEAEKLYTNGAEKKAYVLSAIDAAAAGLKIEYDKTAVSKFIDEFVKITKKINAR